MCEFCGKKDCTLTKDEVINRGPSIEKNAYGIMQGATDEHPATYSFDGIPCFNSYSALIPDEEEEDPHAFLRFKFDEDEGCDSDWESVHVQYPENFQTEQEFVDRVCER